MISKALSTSQKFAALPSFAGKLGEFSQALYPLLVAHADDFGRLQGDPFTVKHLVFPTSPRREADFHVALSALHHVGLIEWYEVDGGKYVQIQRFEDHQQGLHKRTDSKIPGPSGKFPEFPSEENRTEEKRREGNGTEGTSAPTPTVLTFPVVGDARLWHLSTAQVEKWRELYPTVDVLSECRQALAWAEANPTKQKTAGGMPRFLVNWLNKATNSGRRSSPAIGPANKRLAGLVQGGQRFLANRGGS